MLQYCRRAQLRTLADLEPYLKALNLKNTLLSLVHSYCTYRWAIRSMRKTFD